MKRITPQEAEQFVPLDKAPDKSVKDAKYFTLTPSKQTGFEDITYYLDQRVTMFEGMSNLSKDGTGWVYMFSNPSFKDNQYKIGYTNQTLEERGKQLGRSTSVPVPFELKFAFRCFHADLLEREVHKALKSHRIANDREFFNVSYREARKIIEDLGQKYV